jgi:putative molybdenum carrier protein
VDVEIIMADWPLIKVISGGQTGADQAGWRAAKALGYATGGVMPFGFKTECGNQPHLAHDFGAVEDVGPVADYSRRTGYNVKLATGTLIFGDVSEPGSSLTLRYCRVYRKPRLICGIAWHTVAEVQDWIEHYRIAVLNIAGNRESHRPGIGDRVEQFLVQALKPR